MIRTPKADSHPFARLTIPQRILVLSLFLACLLFVLITTVEAAPPVQQPSPAAPTAPAVAGLSAPPVLIPEVRPDPLTLLITDQTHIPEFPPNRRTLYRIRETMRHHWMLTRLDEQKVNCNIYMSQVGEPADREVLGFCGMQVYRQWLGGVCKQTNDRQTPCEGLTLHYIGPIEEQLDVSINLPGAVAYSDLVNCAPWGVCAEQPKLIFKGLEPLATHQIALVHVEVDDGQEFICADQSCMVTLPFTTADGGEATYYVTSSYGDDSLKTTFKYRNFDLGDGTYLFQMIGSEWDFYVPVGAAQWGFFPELDISLTPWLDEVRSTDELRTTQDYAFLAGVLIQRGDVSASDCSDGGLLFNGAASACGIERAREQVIEAQNRFDAQILAAANANQIPAKLLKGLIGQESQFWNGWVIKGEYGYGQMTDEGADLLLTWNVEAFLALCIPAYGVNDCAWGYSELADYPRAYLRGLALQDIGTEHEFDLIAKTLASAAGQSGQIVRNVSGDEPGDVMSYREMWMLSLALYHGGGGCVGTAVQEAYDAGEILSWGSISEYLLGDCQLIASYPYQVIRNAEAAPFVPLFPTD